jgi:anti-sigma factor RsiW
MSQAPAAGSIGPYRIVRVLGSGGWSTVYEVVAEGGARVALKRLGADLAPAAVARFRREVESLRRIDHPGVLRLLDAGFDDGAPYLVTPVVEGTSVRALLARGALGVEGALAVVVAAADAVAAIHGAGLVHRDLKPENLMVTPAGEVVVIDLGLALGPEHSRHTAEDTVTGSVPYMSPEQIDDRAPSAASDVWALGVVLYEAIAGRRPFERARQSEEVAAILGGRFVPLDQLVPTCTAELSRLVASCLAASPSLRPADGGALAAALARQIDWIPRVALAGHRSLLVTSPDSFASSVRAFRLTQAVHDADHALAAGDYFAATRAVERGLHYAPDDAELAARLDRLMHQAPAEPSGRATVKGHAPPPLPRAATFVAPPERERGRVEAQRPSRRWIWALAPGPAAVAATVAGVIASRGDEPAPAVAPVTAGSPATESPPLAPPPEVLPSTSRPANVAPSRPAAWRTRPSGPTP